MNLVRCFIFFMVLFVSGCNETSKAIEDSDKGYIVLIGDSIAEGHPALHGRLHPAVEQSHPAVDLDYQSQPGQLSYEFSELFGVPVLNHGIGGQTSVDIRERWNRDVLHQVYDPGDGRGDQTMDFGGKLPRAVILHVGVNDVFLGLDVNVVKDNFEYFALTTEENNIKLFIDNVGADSAYDPVKESMAKEINGWLLSDLQVIYPHVVIIDYLDWSSGMTGNYKLLKPGMFADTVHPNKAGYTEFAKYAADKISL